MNLEFFIDIRFADPVISLSMNSQGLIYGSSIGRILHYSFHSQQETVIAEFSEECIRGVYISTDNSLYIAVGDRYCIGMMSPTSHKQILHHDFPHSDEICISTQVLTKDELVCVIPLSENNTEGIILTHISTHTKKRYPLLPFKPNTVPYDFDGDRLLWVEWRGKNRVFQYYDFLKSEVKFIAEFDRHYGQLGFCKLSGNDMIVVRDFRTIEIIDIETGSRRQVIGNHNSDIVCLTWAKVREKNFNNSQNGLDNNEVKLIIISIDYDCNICIWDKQGLKKSYNITDFPELTQEYKQKLYFSMGYPYFMCVFDRRIAFSTDVGVLVVNCVYLSGVKILYE
jgi:WD40 repeat protein